MIQLAYLSSAKGLFSPDDIASILVVSREKNARLGITGILLYRGGNILQILEGESENVLKLFAVIEADPRHFGVIRLYQKPIVERDFPEWTMGFYDLSAEGATYLEGFVDIFGPDFDMSTIKPSDAEKLISFFRREMR